MNIRDLIDQLEDIANESGDEAEVRLAMQPGYPMEYVFDRVEAVEQGEDCANCAGDGYDENDVPCTECHGRGIATNPNTPPVVYIIEANQSGYLPGNVCKQIGWRN